MTDDVFGDRSVTREKQAKEWPPGRGRYSHRLTIDCSNRVAPKSIKMCSKTDKCEHKGRLRKKWGYEMGLTMTLTCGQDSPQDRIAWEESIATHNMLVVRKVRIVQDRITVRIGQCR